LDPLTESAYQALLERPSWTADEFAGRLSVEVKAAGRVIQKLDELKLIHLSADRSQVRPVNPQLGLTALVARREAELADRRQELDQGRLAIADLVAGLDKLQQPRGGKVLDVSWGARDIRARVSRLATAATSEVIAMSSSTAAHLDESVIPAPSVNSVSRRFIFSDTRLPDSAYLGRLRNLVEDGAEVRLGRVPLSTLIVDGVAVVLPVSDSVAGQAVGVATIWLPSAVVALVELFERVWSDATPLDQPADGDAAAPRPRERDLLALLVAGTTDESAAYRLGISVRTVRRMVSDLMDRLGARSRFQAGARAAERGWLRPSVEED
jgi:DNA-binding CsgD family transcriptional regulator